MPPSLMLLENLIEERRRVGRKYICGSEHLVPLCRFAELLVVDVLLFSWAQDIRFTTTTHRSHTHISTTNLSDELNCALCLAIEGLNRMGAVNVVEWVLIDGFHYRLTGCYGEVRALVHSIASVVRGNQWNLCRIPKYPVPKLVKMKGGCKKELLVEGVSGARVYLHAPSFSHRCGLETEWAKLTVNRHTSVVCE